MLLDDFNTTDIDNGDDYVYTREGGKIIFTLTTPSNQKNKEEIKNIEENENSIYENNNLSDLLLDNNKDINSLIFNFIFHYKIN